MSREIVSHGSRRAFLGGAIKAAGAALLGAVAPVHALHRRADGISVTGVAQSGLASFDEAMSEFVAAQQVPGAALAVTRHGRLVYARGFGVADRGRQQSVQPTALFRIASVSKPITAVAVLQLVERGKLALDDGAWSLLDLAEPVDARWKQITVLHLLQHRGGWDRERSFDPMFASARVARALNMAQPVEPWQIIRYMLSQPLDFDPGSRDAYSNFGYCMLGRVIERMSGMSYEQYVVREVLAPLGIRRMRLGETLRAKRRAGEVAYYDERGRTGPAIVGEIGAPAPLPYGRWALETMDAHGGWIASAVDLARFAAAFDSPASCPILQPESIATMFARPAGAAGHDADGMPLPVYYGCGWLVRPVGRLGQAHSSHNGSMAGSAALLVRGFAGTNWAVLFNTRSGPDGSLLDTAIDPVMHRAASHVRRWPDTDHFPELL